MKVRSGSDCVALPSNKPKLSKPRLGIWVLSKPWWRFRRISVTFLFYVGMRAWPDLVSLHCYAFLLWPRWHSGFRSAICAYVFPLATEVNNFNPDFFGNGHCPIELCVLAIAVKSSSAEGRMWIAHSWRAIVRAGGRGLQSRSSFRLGSQSGQPRQQFVRWAERDELDFQLKARRLTEVGPRKSVSLDLLSVGESNLGSTANRIMLFPVVQLLAVFILIELNHKTHRQPSPFVLGLDWDFFRIQPVKWAAAQPNLQR